MNEKNSAGATANPSDGLAHGLTFEERIAQLGAGYSNSQSVVHFLDTKAAAVIGVVPILLGILAAVFKWLQDSWQWGKVIGLMGWGVPIVFVSVMLVIAVMLLIIACRTVAAAFSAISPRDPATSLPSTLFPHSPSTGVASPANVAPAETCASRISRFASGEVTRKDALDCYDRQMRRMGEIVHDKMADVKRAVGRLKWMFIWSALALGAMVAMAVISAVVVGFDHHKEQQKIAATAAAKQPVAQSQPSSP